MKTNLAEHIPTAAETLANARMARDKARQAIDASAAKAARVGTLHSRLQVAQ